MKPNMLVIMSKDEITLSTPKGSMSGFKWNGKELVHPTGKKFRFTAAITAEIEAAVKEARVPKWEIKRGHEIDPADKANWEFVGVEKDTHGIYRKKVQDAVVKEVRFAKEDLVK